MKTFNPTSTHPDHAVQAWQILVGKAMNRQTVTYLGLSRLMYQKAAQGVLDKILGLIAFYCIDNELPALTSIVVGKGRGTPGSDIPVDVSQIDALREKVYEYDWFNIPSYKRPTARVVRGARQVMDRHAQHAAPRPSFAANTGKVSRER